MPIDTLLPDFDDEMLTTRRFLERVPMDRADFKPHERSLNLGRLANHIVDLPGLGLMVLRVESLDASTLPPSEPATDGEALLARYDQRVAALRAAIDAATDEELAARWTLHAGPFVAVDKPRAQVLRWLLSHLTHHRAQLGVDLRLLDVPVPPAYGPSADSRASS